MKAMVRRRLRWRRKLFHSKAVSHRTVREGFLFNLDDCHLLWKLFRVHVVLVPNNTLCGYSLDVMLCPNIFFGNSLYSTQNEIQAAIFLRRRQNNAAFLSHLRCGTSNPMWYVDVKFVNKWKWVEKITHGIMRSQILLSLTSLEDSSGHISYDSLPELSWCLQPGIIFLPPRWGEQNGIEWRRGVADNISNQTPRTWPIARNRMPQSRSRCSTNQCSATAAQPIILSSKILARYFSREPTS